MKVSFTALGAGQEVGRSCFILTFHIADKKINIMLDAGAHVRPSEEKFPDVSRIPKDLHAVIITHYHLDHAGALPWLKEIAACLSGDAGVPCQVFMTAPTRLLAPLVLQEFAAAEGAYFAVHIERSFAEAQVLGLHERKSLFVCGEEVAITTFYAGHVLGGVMVLLECRGMSVVYTGDYSAVADGLMDGVRVPSHLLPPNGIDLVISESTYATSVRECVVKRRSKLLKSIEACVGQKGVALVPVLSVGRAQELACLMMSSELVRSSKTRFYTTSSTSSKAFKFFPLFQPGWWSKDGRWSLPDEVTFVENVADVKDRPAVVFTAPAALENGKALEFFTHLCSKPENLVLITGYCPQGSVGNRLIVYHSKRTRLDQRVVQITPEKTAVVECALDYVPFTGHTDKVGIINTLKLLNPRNIILVHGDHERMTKLAQELRPNALVPENFKTIDFDFEELVPVDLPHHVLFDDAGSLRPQIASKHITL